MTSEWKCLLAVLWMLTLCLAALAGIGAIYLVKQAMAPPPVYPQLVLPPVSHTPEAEALRNWRPDWSLPGGNPYKPIQPIPAPR